MIPAAPLTATTDRNHSRSSSGSYSGSPPDPEADTSTSSVASSPGSYTTASEFRRRSSTGPGAADSIPSPLIQHSNVSHDHPPVNRLHSPQTSLSFRTSPILSNAGSITPIMGQPSSPIHYDYVGGVVGLGTSNARSNGLGTATPLSSLSTNRRSISPKLVKRRSTSPAITRITREREASTSSHVATDDAGLPYISSSSTSNRSSFQAHHSSRSSTSSPTLSLPTSSSKSSVTTRTGPSPSPSVNSVTSISPRFEASSIMAESNLGSPLMRVGFSPISWTGSAKEAEESTRKITKRDSIDSLLERNQHTTNTTNASPPPELTASQLHERIPSPVPYTTSHPSTLTAAPTSIPQNRISPDRQPSRDEERTQRVARLGSGDVITSSRTGTMSRQRLAIPQAFVSASTSSNGTISPEIYRSAFRHSTLGVGDQFSQQQQHQPQQQQQHSRGASTNPLSYQSTSIRIGTVSNGNDHGIGKDSASRGTTSSSESTSSVPQRYRYDQPPLHQHQSSSPSRRDSLTREALARDRRQSARSEVSSYASGPIVDSLSNGHDYAQISSNGRFSSYANHRDLNNPPLHPQSAPSKLTMTTLSTLDQRLRDTTPSASTPSRMSSYSRSSVAGGRAPSRAGTVSGRSTTAFSHRPIDTVEGEEEAHLVLLYSALESFGRHFYPESISSLEEVVPESIAFVKSMSNLVRNTSRTHTILRGLSQDITQAKIDAALDFEAQESGNGRRETIKFERGIKNAMRSSDEEVRGLTEALISFTRVDKERQLLRLQKDNRSTTPERRSISRAGSYVSPRSASSIALSSRRELRNPLQVDDDSPVQRASSVIATTPARSGSLRASTSMGDHSSRSSRLSITPSSLGRRSSLTPSSLGRTFTTTPISTSQMVDRRSSRNFDYTRRNGSAELPERTYRAPSPTMSAASRRLSALPPLSSVSSSLFPPSRLSPANHNSYSHRSTSPLPRSSDQHDSDNQRGLSPSTSMEHKLKGLHLVDQLNSPTKSATPPPSTSNISPSKNGVRRYSPSPSQSRSIDRPVAMTRTLSELDALRAISPEISRGSREGGRPTVEEEFEEEMERKRLERMSEAREFSSRNR